MKEHTNREQTLLLIADRGPRTSAKIQLAVGIDKRQSACDILKRLKAKGLVGCEREGRLGWWSLTPKGVVEVDRLESRS
jgi:DNA-binding PadR family transcriptional regulator